MKSEQDLHPFIRYLYSMAEGENRGALADLRRGSSGQAGSVPVTFQYVAPWVPENERNSWREKVYYILATLFAQYQAGGTGNNLITNQGDFGAHCRAFTVKKKQSGSFETRFSSLLKAHRDDVGTLLRQLLGLLRGEDIPINWNQLFSDLTYWNNANQTVQRKWANSYWSYQKPEDTGTQNQKERK